MKNSLPLSLFCLILLIWGIHGNCQEQEPIMTSMDSIYIEADILPHFPGGDEELNFFLVKEINLRNKSKQLLRATSSFLISFVIEKDGSISNISFPEGCPNLKICNTIKSVFLNMPRWSPAIKDNRPIRYNYIIKISPSQLASNNIITGLAHKNAKIIPRNIWNLSLYDLNFATLLHPKEIKQNKSYKFSVLNNISLFTLESPWGLAVSPVSFRFLMCPLPGQQNSVFDNFFSGSTDIGLSIKAHTKNWFPSKYTNFQIGTIISYDQKGVNPFGNVHLWIETSFVIARRKLTTLELISGIHFINGLYDPYKRNTAKEKIVDYGLGISIGLRTKYNPYKNTKKYFPN